MRVLVTADWHVGGARPRCRLDEDWIGAQETDILAVWKIAEEQRVDSIWILGDLFDTPRVSTEAVNMVLRVFEKAPCEIRILCGNHDLPYHNFGELERSSIGIVLHKYKMLASDPKVFLAAYPFGTEPEYARLSSEMQENGEFIWATHRLTFPNATFRPVEGIGYLAQDLLDGCPAARLIMTGDYHHAFDYVGPDGRRVITPGCLNIQDADMADYQPMVFILETAGLFVKKVPLPVQGKVTTAYLEQEHAAAEMRQSFIAALSSGRISMRTFSAALAEKIAVAPEGVRRILDEVAESFVKN